MNYGEKLLQHYLKVHRADFQYEPEAPEGSPGIDFVLQHSRAGAIQLEVKEIHYKLPRAGTFNFYHPVRSHIKAGMRKFTNSPDTVNAVVLVCPPSSHVELRRPDIMLGAMYGDYSLRIPFNPMLGRLESDEASYEFRPGEGMTMGLNKKKNTRLSAVISLHNWTIHTSADGMDPEHVPGVTVWENAHARAPMPRDLFRGAMDSWWTVEGEEQRLSFIGDRLLGLELARRNWTGPAE